MSNPEDPKVRTTPHVIKEEVLAEGKWVKLEQTTYVDPAGNTRTWETAKRTTRRSNTEADGVGIVALLKRTLHKDCVVMVKQFRPPMGGNTLEFPAGLIDEGETADVAALRELKEETGYKGKVVGVTPVTCLDPGLSNSTTQIVLVDINGDDVENVNPTQQLGDGGEFHLLFFLHKCLFLSGRTNHHAGLDRLFQSLSKSSFYRSMSSSAKSTT
ncbi:ADP-sugar pyrophosphatase isoform X1 [Poeciliopsis prolifica]|uniref:ADP-sugar pyrophosphatase isoform X1 n=1 Tax=Poeciliopsis prolifica TaxID=188132 RepID=UPI0024141637|nr:ADP-sugar pyrophosphatase isoform X1 [Poeciliopsis prolifica]XP_054911549.1 ADP-sugar pyrophosphatase isoform X1 [Poeciliopsis prolifica]